MFVFEIIVNQYFNLRKECGKPVLKKWQDVGYSFQWNKLLIIQCEEIHCLSLSNFNGTTLVKIGFSKNDQIIFKLWYKPPGSAVVI